MRGVTVYERVLSMDRLQEKHGLYVKLGVLFGPLFRLAEHPEQYDTQERAETVARFYAERGSLQNDFQRFSAGQPGHLYLSENIRFHTALDRLRGRLEAGHALADVVQQQFSEAQAALDAVPIPRTSVILEAGSPFTAYCRLRELCEVDATAALIWLDPFMSASNFHRYLTGVRSGVPITLVTSEPGPHAGRRDQTRWAEFLDVSRLFAAERGQALYTLVVQPNLHDRWVVFDDKRIYSLGGSAKDAADRDYFTITTVEASAENLQKIRNHITTGTCPSGKGAILDRGRRACWQCCYSVDGSWAR
jgi:hypothetical protein